jgi:hypothetical protein
MRGEHKSSKSEDRVIITRADHRKKQEQGTVDK